MYPNSSLPKRFRSFLIQRRLKKFANALGDTFTAYAIWRELYRSWNATETETPQRCELRDSRQHTEDWFPSRTSVDGDSETAGAVQEEKEGTIVPRNYTRIRNKTSLDGSSSAIHTVSEIVESRQRAKLGLISIISSTLPFLIFRTFFLCCMFHFYFGRLRNW